MAFPFRHKVLLLVFAYACVAGIFVCALMAPWNQPEEDLAHAPNLRDPCSWGIFLHSRHIGKDDFFKKRFNDPEYREMVWRAVKPQPHHVERFAMSNQWAPYSPDGKNPMPKRELLANDEPSESVVLMLQASPDRLPFMSIIAEQWAGPVALAIYIPAPASTPAAQECGDKVRAYLQEHTLRGVQEYAVSFLYATGPVPNLHCDPAKDLFGFQEPFTDPDMFRRRFGGRPWHELWNADYPVNKMRRLARSMVRDDCFVFLADADFVVNYDMHRKLTTGQPGKTLRGMREAWETSKARHTLVLPAFERLANVPARKSGVLRCVAASSDVTADSECFMYRDYDVPSTKAALRTMVEDGRVSVFHEATFKKGHGCYNPHKWLDGKQGYKFTYTPPCEPYVVAIAGALPPFEVRFTGRQRDKVSILTHMAVWGFEFRVVPDLFLVHLPHEPVYTLQDISADVSIQMNMAVAPYVVAHRMMENAYFEPEFQQALPQMMPGLGSVKAKKPRKRPEEVPPGKGVAAYNWLDCDTDYSTFAWNFAFLGVALVLVTLGVFCV